MAALPVGEVLLAAEAAREAVRNANPSTPAVFADLVVTHTLLAALLEHLSASELLDEGYLTKVQEAFAALVASPVGASANPLTSGSEPSLASDVATMVIDPSDLNTEVGEDVFFSVMVLDESGIVVVDCQDTIEFTTDDGTATLPETGPMLSDSNGVRVYTVVFNAGGTWFLTVRNVNAGLEQTFTVIIPE